MNEDYVSFATAKLLKEKGFDEECNTAYFNGTLVDYTMFGFCLGGDLLYCPTLQKAMKWLRETHNIAIETEWEHLWYAYVKPMTSKPSEEDCYQCESPKYEQACEEAIRYCLENLI